MREERSGTPRERAGRENRTEVFFGAFSRPAFFGEAKDKKSRIEEWSQKKKF